MPLAGLRLALVALAALLWLVLAPSPAQAQSSGACQRVGTTAVDFGSIAIGNDGQRSVNTAITVRCAQGSNVFFRRAACFRFPAGNAQDTAAARRLTSGSQILTYSIRPVGSSTQLGTGASDYASVNLPTGSNVTATLNVTFVLAGGQAAGKAAALFTAMQPVTLDIFLQNSCGIILESRDSFVLPVQARVGTACNLSAIGAVDFGSQPGLWNRVEAVGSVQLACTAAITWSLAFDGGRYPSGGERRMRGVTDAYVAYRLYRDAARASAIGVGGTISGTGTGTLQSTPIYGRIEARAPPPIGTYRDVVVVTLSF